MNLRPSQQAAEAEQSQTHCSESPEGWEDCTGREATKEACTEHSFSARAVTTRGYRSSDHQLHLIKISKEVECMREGGDVRSQA